MKTCLERFCQKENKTPGSFCKKQQQQKTAAWAYDITWNGLEW